jgi:glycosyltransferase involved in cell wall biosynthesis
MTRRIGVLSLIDNLHFGGDENRLLVFAQTIDRRRFDHMVVTISSANTEVDQRCGGMRQQFLDAGVEVISLGEHLSNSAPLSIKAFQLARTGAVSLRVVQRLNSLIRQRKVDLISIHLNAANPVGVLAGMATGARSVVTTYSVRNYAKEPLRLLAAKQFTLGLADAVITDSEARSRDIKKWSYRRPRVAVIPNGIWPPTTARTAEEMRRLFGLPTDPQVTIIGQVSSLIEYKGQSVLLDAARAVIDRDSRVAFLLVGYSRGGDDYRKRLEKQAADLGIANRVRIISYPGHIGDVWKAIDIHVHASLFDSLPNAIIEGMSLGKPAVVTSVGGIPEMVEHEKTGLVVPPGDPQELSRQLLRLLRDRDSSRRFGEAARLRYEDRCRPEVMTARLENLFTEIVT